MFKFEKLKKPKVLVLTGFGINAEEELCECFKLAGGNPHLQTICEFISEKENSLHNYDILALPGGFSYGDHLGAGTILANQLKNNKLSTLKQFVASGKPVIGICNGFQVLMALNVFAWNDDAQPTESIITLAANDKKQFENRWIYARPNPDNSSFWLKDLSSVFPLPVRHGEGKVVVSNKNGPKQDKTTSSYVIALQYVNQDGTPTMEYPLNPNGSFDSIAGLTNRKGNVLGLMPHPEAFMLKKHFPLWQEQNHFYANLNTGSQGYGMIFFQNAIKYVRQNQQHLKQEGERQLYG